MKLRREYQEALNFYLQTLVAQNKSAHTLTNYSLDLKRFLSWYQVRYGMALNHLNPSIITEYQHQLIEGGLTARLKKLRYQILRFLRHPWRSLKNLISHPEILIYEARALGVNSQRRHLSSIKNFLETLVESSYDKGRIKENPVRPKLHKVKVKQVDVEPTQVLTHEEWARLNEKTWRVSDRLLIHLLYYGGLRLSEVLSLKANSFHPQSGTLLLKRKGGKRHQLPILRPKEIGHLWLGHLEKEALKRIIEVDSPLFSSRKGAPMSSRGLSRKIKSLLGRAELPEQLSPHSFRKGCATALYQQTKDLLQVRDYLNHTDAKVTQTYIDEGVLHSLRQPIHVAKFGEERP